MANEKLIPPVKRTVIVLDHSSKFQSLSKQHIDFDGGGKKSKGKGSSAVSPVFKSSWTCSLEAAVEYCRIVYDIFPTEYMVSKRNICFWCISLCSIYNDICLFIYTVLIISTAVLNQLTLK